MNLLNSNLVAGSMPSREKLFIWHLQCLQFLGRGNPVPLHYWLGLRLVIDRLFRSYNPLTPPDEILPNTGASLQILELQELLGDDVLGWWSIGKPTIHLLWQNLSSERPKTIIECGSGISTLILATYAARHRLKGGQAPRVFSLEQNVQIKQEVEDRLSKHGLKKHVQIVHAPISKEGGYEVDTNTLHEVMGPTKADWLLIDGPCGPDGCRMWTLPVLARFCRPGARWFLDDAFRDAEMQILSEWGRLPGVAVEGIYPIDKGLGTGLLENPERVPIRCKIADIATV